MRIILLLLVLPWLMIGCSTIDRAGSGDVVETVGTIRYVEVEGGFYGIVAEDGRQFDPMELAEQYKEDGLRVRFRARTAEDVVSIHMWGTVVEILSIERL